MVKLISNGSENDESHLQSVKLSSTSCSDEAIQAPLNINRNSLASVVNGNCETHETPLLNGNSNNDMSINGVSVAQLGNASHASMVNGNSETSKSPLVKRIPNNDLSINGVLPVKNGNSSQASSVLNDNCEMHETPLVNGKSDNDISINGVSAVQNGNSSHASSMTNVKCETHETLLVNGNYNNDISINGVSVVQHGVSPRASYSSVVNSNCETSLVHENYNNDIPVNGVSPIKHEKSPQASYSSMVNGNCEKHETPLVNGNSKKIINRVTAVNGQKLLVKKVPTVDRNCKDKNQINFPVISNTVDSKVPVEQPTTANGMGTKDYLSGTNSLSDDTTGVCISKALCNEDNLDENQTGFTEVVNKKKRNRNKNKNRQKERDSNKKFNLPPGLKAENIRGDNRRDKICSEKAPPAHIAQKLPPRNSATVNSKKSYSSALVNGQNVKKCQESFNSDLSGTCTSPNQLQIHQTKSATNNDMIANSSKHNHSTTKIEKIDSFVQTDNSQNEILLSQKECLPSPQEISEPEKASSPQEISEPEKASSPIDYVDDTDCSGEITDESSNIPYCDSLASNDSGRGDSEDANNHQKFQYEFPNDKTGLLIGKHGKFKNHLEKKAGVRIAVGNPNKDTAVLEIKGTVLKVERVKELIRERFPYVTLTPYHPNNSLSKHYLPTLPQYTSFFTIIPCVFNPNSFWVQQYGHPLVFQLEDLENKMSHHYNTVPDIPAIEYPEIGNVVAVPACEINNAVKWIRGSILDLMPDGLALIRFLDHGGDYVVPVNSVRPMRNEFFSMQFFAAECSLFGVQPLGEMWSPEAFQEFTRLCCGNYIPSCKVAKKEFSTYYVHILVFDPEQNALVDVAASLVERGFADWIPELQQLFSDQLQQLLPDQLQQLPSDQLQQLPPDQLQR